MMVDFNSVLDKARQLSPQDQAKLIDALWDLVPENLELPLHPEWESELKQRVAEIQSDSVTTVPWSQIQSEALTRVYNGRID